MRSISPASGYLDLRDKRKLGSRQQVVPGAKLWVEEHNFSSGHRNLLDPRDAILLSLDLQTFLKNIR